MEPEGINDISSEDVAEAIKLIKEVPELTSSVLDTVQSLLKRVKKGEFQSLKGLSLLDLKNQTLLSYVINLTYIIFKKLSGKAIENDSAVGRLVELRTVMEKMRPIEDKLKYQINKTIAAATSGNVDTNDPLQFKANPDNLGIQDSEDDDDNSKKQEEAKVYVPPKISAAYFEDTSIEAQKKKILERAQKRALSSTMLQELRKEYDTGPEEIKETIDPYKIKLNEELKERERYEEEFMLRLPMTKRKRHEMKQFTTVTNFNARFDDISALDMNPEDMSLKKHSGLKKKKSFGKKGKKKGFKRKRH